MIDSLIRFVNALNRERSFPVGDDSSINAISPASKADSKTVSFKQGNWHHAIMLSPDKKSLNLYVTADVGKGRNNNEKFQASIEKLFQSVGFSCPMKIYGHKQNIPFDQFDEILERIMSLIDLFIKHPSTRHLHEDVNA